VSLIASGSRRGSAVARAWPWQPRPCRRGSDLQRPSSGQQRHHEAVEVQL